MKKSIIITSISLLLVIGLIIIITKNNKKVYTDIDGIKYAILVDGVSSNSFPSGNYKVDINCTNADAYWNSITNKVIIKNIKGNVSCDVEFNSITSSDYLNTYITGLSGTTQGDGGFVHEIGESPDYTISTIVKTFGTTPVYFRNTLHSSIDQTQVNNYWSFNNSTGVFTSDPSKMTTSGTTNYYHAYMQVPSSGYYRVCYTIDQSSTTYNYLYFANTTTTITNASPSTTAPISETCIDMGYFQTDDYINISERAYSGPSSPVMAFKIEKTEDVIEFDTGYRYEGENPNNYIMFNNELWRIIGVFSTEYDTNNDGTTDTTTNLVKIIREEPIGLLVWDKSNINDWPNSSLYHLLNEQYYDWQTNKSNVSTYCYGLSNTIPSKCDYSVKGIQDGYRGMIVKSKWYLGGVGKSGYILKFPDSIYSYERDANAIYTGRSASTSGYVGLMYGSDYLYGVLGSNCTRKTVYSLYGNATCSGKNWLYGKGYEWTILSYSNNAISATYLLGNGIINNNEVKEGKDVRPTLYLSPDVYRVSGTGTITDPYIIGMAS